MKDFREMLKSNNSVKNKRETMQDLDPWYYENDNSGHWIKSPTYEWDARYFKACQIAVRKELACWLPAYDPDIPF